MKDIHWNGRNLTAAATVILGALALAPASARAQELSVGVYGNVDYQAGHTAPVDGPATNQNHFSIPTLDLFLRGTADKWSFLSEVLFDIDQGNTIGVDLDRMQVSYEYAEWLKVTGGRFHTSIGYYNTAFPQGGAIYLLPLHRPLLVDQHDNASLIPTSTVGLNLHGRVPFGVHAFSYDLDVSNGRGRTSDELTNGQDLNQSKAFNLRLRYEFHDLIIGANAYVDWIPPRTADPVQPETLREQIFGAHIAYVEHPWHLIAEGVTIQHVGLSTYQTLAGLAEFGYTVRQITPYTRFTATKFPSVADPFWAATHQQERGNFQTVDAGIKWMPNESIAVKFELEYSHAQFDTREVAATQVAFGF